MSEQTTLDKAHAVYKVAHEFYETSPDLYTTVLQDAHVLAAIAQAEALTRIADALELLKANDER